MFVRGLQEENLMCFNCRLDYYRCYDDSNDVPTSLKSGLVLLDEAKKVFKRQVDDLVGMNIAHPTYNHRHNKSLTYYKSQGAINKAMKLYDSLLALSSISKTVKQAISS